MVRISLAIAAAFALAGCAQDSCRAYSRFTCDQLESKTYNVYYYDKPHESYEQRELYIGQATGLKSCGSAAWNAAELYKDERDGEWSYVCCLQTKDSSCAEKHR